MGWFPKWSNIAFFAMTTNIWLSCDHNITLLLSRFYLCWIWDISKGMLRILWDGQYNFQTTWTRNFTVNPLKQDNNYSKYCIPIKYHFSVTSMQNVIFLCLTLSNQNTEANYFRHHSTTVLCQNDSIFSNAQSKLH